MWNDWWKLEEGRWTYWRMKTDRSRLMGSKEPSGYFCEAFSYIRFLFFRGSNYSIKTNRQPAVRVRRSLRAGCVELMSSRTNGITSLLVTCDLFKKRWRCLLWFVTFLFRALANGNLIQPSPHLFVPLLHPAWQTINFVICRDGNVKKKHF